jgi:hypothetical protein
MSPGFPGRLGQLLGLALLIGGAVALLALWIAGDLSGSGTQAAIVVERLHTEITMTSATAHTTRHALDVDSVIETSANGSELRDLTSNSVNHRNAQYLGFGNVIELYEPADNTIYITTQLAQQAAINRQIQAHQPKGSHTVTVTGKGRSISYSPGNDDIPGRMSVYAKELRAGDYRVAGHTTIDGRPALKLVPVARSIAVGTGSGAREQLPVAYVAPGTYDPIESVANFSFSQQPHVKTEVTTYWSAYRVLPVTRANQRLLSLTALHPSARVVHSAAGYNRASSIVDTTSAAT